MSLNIRRQKRKTKYCHCFTNKFFSTKKLNQKNCANSKSIRYQFVLDYLFQFILIKLFFEKLELKGEL